MGIIGIVLKLRGKEKLKLKIINYMYYNNKSGMEQYNAPVLIFVCRDKDLKRHLVFICDKKNLAPEMYAEKKEYEKHVESYGGINMSFVVYVEDAPDSNYGEKTVKLTTTFPWEVRQVRKLFTHTYLADVKWEKMCVEKMGLRTPYIEVPDDYNENWLKVDDIKQLPKEEHFYCPIRWIAWDIETNMEVVFPIFGGWKDAEKCEIISISAYDSYGKHEYHRFIWHPLITKNKVYLHNRYWQRLGEYYVPALKKKKKYNEISVIVQHEFTNEIDMLKAYIDWFSKSQPDCHYGFNSEGGYRISSRKGSSRKRLFTGYDMPYLYHRCKTLRLLDYLQRMSPLPNVVKGVKWRTHGKEVSVAIEGVCQLDFIYTNEIFMYHKKFNDFRGGSLQSYMSFFLGFGKVSHKEQVFELWRDNIPSDYDPTKPEDVGVKKKKNLVKELYDRAKNSIG